MMHNHPNAQKKKNNSGFSDLLLSMTELAFSLVNLQKPVGLDGGCLMRAWNALKEQYDTQALEDRIQLLKKFTQNQLTDKKSSVIK